MAGLVVGGGTAVSGGGGLLLYSLWRDWRRHQKAVRTANERAALFSAALDTPIGLADDDVEWDQVALQWWMYFQLGSETGDPNVWLRVWWAWEMLREEAQVPVWRTLLHAPVKEKSELLRRVEALYRIGYPKGVDVAVQAMDDKHDEFVNWMRETASLPE